MVLSSANKIVKGKQITVCIHVDNCKIFHKLPQVIDKTIDWFRAEYESIFEDMFRRDEGTHRQGPQIPSVHVLFLVMTRCTYVSTNFGGFRPTYSYVGLST